MENIKFYEFNNHEYYALIGANDINQAFKIYHEQITGESIEEIKAEGLPDEINREDAFAKFKQGCIKYDVNDEGLIFDGFGDGVGTLLVDGCLL